VGNPAITIGSYQYTPFSWAVVALQLIDAAWALRAECDLETDEVIRPVVPRW
jgi:hypothetical protein